MLKAYKDYWKKYADFKDRSTVADYWWTVLCNTIVSVIIGIFTVAGVLMMFSENASDNVSMVQFLLLAGLGLSAAWTLVTIIPNAAIMVRRLRDAGLSPWWGLLLILAFVLPIIAYINTLNGIQMELAFAAYTGDYDSMITNLFVSNIVLYLVAFLVRIFFFVVSLLPTKNTTATTEKAAAKVETASAEKITTAKTTAKKPAAKKATKAKKTATKKTTTTKKAAPKTAAKKATTTKKAALKTAAKKTTTKKAAPKAAPKTAAKKTTTTKKAAPKKTTAPKTTAKKSAAKKATGNK